MRFVALLRGINVGGRNMVAMADLREAFEAAGFDAVSTYIQSGNVLFESNAPSTSLEKRIEAALERRFHIPLVVMVRSHRQLRTIVERAPKGFGQKPRLYHSDVVFLKKPLTAARAMRVVDLRDGVDQAWPGTGVVYFARLSERLTQSRLSRVASSPEYQLMSIRTWTTVTKLLGLLDAQR
jgi:uncharacterized protein (DUF1697 family)